MTIPNHLSLTAGPLMLLPSVVSEYQARLQAHFAQSNIGVIDRFVRKQRKASAQSPTVLAAAMPSVALSPEGEALTPDTSSGEHSSDYLCQITIRGPLLQRAVYIQTDNGPMLCIDGYDRLEAALKSATTDENCKGIFVDMDSPGGMTSGCMELSDLTNACAQHKPIVTFANGLCASAAYAIACGTREIIGRESTLIGSIGVIQPRYDVTTMNKKQGLRIELIKSGHRKSWGHPDSEVNDEELAAMQARVDKLAGKFFDRVSNYRGLSVETIADFQADIFLSEDAVQNGLANEVGEYDDAFARLNSLAFKSTSQNPGSNPDNPGTPPKTTSALTPPSNDSTAFGLSARADGSTIKEKPMSKMTRAGVTGKLRFAAAAMASAKLKAMEEDEKSAMDEDELEAAIDDEADEEVNTMDDDEVAAMDDEDDAKAESDEDPEMMDEEDENYSAKSFRATASRIAGKALARAKKTAPIAKTGDPAADAVAEDRARVKAIAALPEATGREALANSLAASGMSVADAKDALSKSPKAQTKPTPLTATPGPGAVKPGSRSPHLDAVLASADGMRARAGQK